MEPIDDIARMNMQNWSEGGVCEEHRGTRPSLGLDVSGFDAYTEGRASALPAPFGNCFSDRFLADIRGKQVLCLGGGGGQQSVALSLLGGHVTVLDLSARQLEMDRLAAEHYGYEVATVNADMRDLSALADCSFDRVYQPISMIFVPSTREVYSEVARVTKLGGLYEVGHVNPVAYSACMENHNSGWDGTAYRMSEPYGLKTVRRREDGSESMREGEPIGEFVHLLSDIFNDLIDVGFSIRRVWEGTDHIHHRSDAEPGSYLHMQSIVALYFGILAERERRGE
jgi:ubiquinone/menaquinone biosynthesis C-methylase UbiE